MTAITESDLKRLEDLIVNGHRTMETRFNGLESRLDGMDKRLDSMDKRLDGMDTRMTTLVEGQMELKGKVSNIETRLNYIETTRAETKADFKDLGNRLGAIEGNQQKIEGRIEVVQTIANKLPDYSEKIGELKNWKQIAVILFTAVVSAGIGWSVRGR